MYYKSRTKQHWHFAKIPTTAEEKNLPFGSSAQNGSIQYYEQGHKLELVLDELHAKRIFSRH